MKIDIKPTIIYGTDYHEFYPYEDKNFMKLGFMMGYEEITDDSGNYKAVVWPAGAEDELFEFIFTNQEAWETLTNE